MPLWVREVDRLLFDEVVHLLIIVASSVEGREPNNHLIGQNTQSPPVDWEAVAFFVEDFRSEVLRRPTERVCLSVFLQDLGQAKVCEADVPIFIHEDVFWLQVSVNYMFLVKMTDGDCYLGRVELRPFFREASAVPQMHEQFSSSHESHHEEYFLLCLEHIVHSHQERMVCLEKDLLFELGTFYLIVVDDDILPETFHGIHLFAALLLHQEHLTKASSPNDFPNDEILEADLLVSFLGVEGLTSLSEGLSIQLAVREVVIRDLC
mmetsp:Transcript_42273/g.40497  ORF Transcript_42273/g.40497 Transcript_42273/m.40497 type:complete len:264 (-) Transcript_42273:562-1353(-)